MRLAAAQLLQVCPQKKQVKKIIEKKQVKKKRVAKQVKEWRHAKASKEIELQEKTTRESEEQRIAELQCYTEVWGLSLIHI